MHLVRYVFEFIVFVRVSKFCLNISFVGQVTAITIRHDNSGASPDWFLDKVVVEDSTQTYTFPAYRWLADDKLDKSISAYLTPGNHGKF